MKKLILILMLAVGTSAHADNQSLFSKYCTGKADSAEIPGVNYLDSDVLTAAKRLSEVNGGYYHFYNSVISAYGVRVADTFVLKGKIEQQADGSFVVLDQNGKVAKDRNGNEARVQNATLAKDSKFRDAVVIGKKTYFYVDANKGGVTIRDGAYYVDTPSDAPDYVTREAHAFLVQLCGEFRDRATMIEEKINWAKRLFILPTDQQVAFDETKDLWAQMSADSYEPYLRFAGALWRAKDSSLHNAQKKTFTLGKYTNVDLPIEPMTVCETRFIFSEYIANQKYLNEIVKNPTAAEIPTLTTKYYDQDGNEIVNSALKWKKDNLVYYMNSLNQIRVEIAQLEASGKTDDVTLEQIKYKKHYEGNYVKTVADLEKEIAEIEAKLSDATVVYIKDGRKDLSSIIIDATWYETEYAPKLAQYEKTCSKRDREEYYEYRGDKNMKHNSPEANGMIWTAESVANQCESTTKAKSNVFGVTDQSCVDYFSKPFASRWNAARAGLGAWLFHHEKYNAQFDNTQSRVTVYSHADGKSKPFGLSPTFTWDDFLADWLNIKDAWSRPDMGMNELSGFDGSKEADVDFVYERLRDAVDRHTDWYASAYTDGMAKSESQWYSPLVASSHIIEASDGFTRNPKDGKRTWMFVFRIKMENRYNTQKVADHVPVNFDTMWFDETSLGTVGLAKGERAMDRLGSAVETEYDAILELHNTSDSW